MPLTIHPNALCFCFWIHTWDCSCMYCVQKKQALCFYIHYFKTTEINLQPQMSNCQESKYCKTVSISTFTAPIFLFRMNFEPKMASTGWAGCAGAQESVTASLLDQRQKTAFGIAELSIRRSTVWNPSMMGRHIGAHPGKVSLDELHCLTVLWQVVQHVRCHYKSCKDGWRDTWQIKLYKKNPSKNMKYQDNKGTPGETSSPTTWFRIIK